MKFHKNDKVWVVFTSTRSMYAWTDDKDVMKMFRKQRATAKFTYLKMDVDDFDHYIGERSIDSGRYMMNTLKLRSNGYGTEYTIISTINEMNVYEHRCHRKFSELSSLDSIDPDRIHYFVNVYANIIDRYLAALDFIGFRPKELNAPYLSSETDYDWSRITIDGVYDGMSAEEFQKFTYSSLPGASVLNDVSNKIIYSIESFIMVMEEELTGERL